MPAFPPGFGDNALMDAATFGMGPAAAGGPHLVPQSSVVRARQSLSLFYRCDW